MSDILQFSTTKLQRIVRLKKQIERLQGQLEKLAGGATPVAPKGKRRSITAAGRKAMSLAAKKRWAKIKAANRT